MINIFNYAGIWITSHGTHTQMQGGFNCLHLASAGGHLDVVKYFFAKGANIYTATEVTRA